MKILISLLMMMVFLALTLVFLVATVTNAFALPDYLLPMPRLRLNVVGVVGKDSLNSLTHARMMRGAKYYLREYGILITIGKLYKVADPHPYFREKCNDVFCIADEYSADYHAYKHLRKSWQLLHVISPPIAVDGRRYIGGMASHCSVKSGSFSYSNAQKFNSQGDKRYRHSLNAMVHEILHTLGADHDNSNANVMHEDASRYVANRVLPLNRKSINEILRCVK